MAFVCPSHPDVRWGPALLEVAEHLLNHGKWRINSLFSSPGEAVALPIKLPLSKPMNFLAFSLLIVSMTTLVGE